MTHTTAHLGRPKDLRRTGGSRVQEHKLGEIPGFTQKYGLTRLVYYEETPDVLAAIAREKQIKGWLRRGRLH